jgi:hypothetical protein
VAHQVALTVAAEVRPEAAGELRALLASMGDGVANGSVVDFEPFAGLHFARFVLVDEAHDLGGAELPAWLVYMADLDVSKERHLGELAGPAGEGVDRLFAHCAGYPAAPTRDARLAYLRGHVIAEQARYVNTVGRSARQIHQEARLHDRVEGYLDANAHELRGLAGGEIRRNVRELVESDEALHWARRPADGLDRGFRTRELVHAISMPLLLLLVSPLLLVGLPFFLVALRLHERRDAAPHLKPPPELVQELALLEDQLVQNPFTAIGLVKPGPFRRLTLLGILAAIDYATRHLFNRGNLAGVKTIHFARWIFLDGRRRMIFASNYDGSLESYMDDFIDKIAWGLNFVFSNGHGYPRTRFLVLGGARDELAFKDYLRLHQVPTRVWHSAYGRLSAANVANNERIRAGLQGDAGMEEAKRWVRAL